jgi:hypothetical protein
MHKNLAILLDILSRKRPRLFPFSSTIHNRF